MRRWFGSDVPNLLGENMTSGTVLRFWSAICKGIDRFEPRFKVVKITAIGTPPTMRKGDLGFDVQGIYYPRGHLGDFSVSIPKTFVAGVDVVAEIIRIPSLRIPELPRVRPFFVSSEQQFFSLDLALDNTLLVAPSFVENSNDFFVAIATNILLAPAPFGADTFYVPVVATSYSLSPSLFTDSDLAYAPTVTPLGNVLSPILFDDPDDFYSAIVEGDDPADYGDGPAPDGYHWEFVFGDDGEPVMDGDQYVVELVADDPSETGFTSAYLSQGII
jgi:hypothetical protein